MGEDRGRPEKRSDQRSASPAKTALSLSKRPNHRFIVRNVLYVKYTSTYVGRSACPSKTIPPLSDAARKVDLVNPAQPHCLDACPSSFENSVGFSSVQDPNSVLRTSLLIRILRGIQISSEVKRLYDTVLYSTYRYGTVEGRPCETVVEESEMSWKKSTSHL